VKLNGLFGNFKTAGDLLLYHAAPDASQEKEQLGEDVKSQQEGAVTD